MDLTRLVLVLAILVLDFSRLASANFAFPVHHKFKGRHLSLSTMKAHDSQRHRRLLSAIDLNLGGNGAPAEAGHLFARLRMVCHDGHPPSRSILELLIWFRLYYTKLTLGSPPKDYHVQVDTGSDLLWVNCVECTDCPKESDLGMQLQLYDPKDSQTSKPVFCDGDFCKSTYDGQITGCKPETSCLYSITYGDGGKTSGYFVKDDLTFNQVNGNFHTAPANSSIVFGCGAKQSGGLGSSSDEALDGIIGFGQANSSVLSQLAASGKVKKIFSHCLDNIGGGGIFSIGEVVEPKIKTTPLLSGQAHYNAVLKNIQVDDEALLLTTSIFDLGSERGAVIDSGTTLAYLPEFIYEQLMDKASVMARQPGLKLHLIDNQFTCFDYSGNVDDGFPVVKFHFDKSLSLSAYPHDYLFKTKDGDWCVGWQKSMAKTKSGRDMTLLGDMVLTNRLVVYDLEKMTIGWTEFNCEY
ncbi:Aspartic proteinase-like protein 2 [Senna tora]|uniref:Aspartic proteinase-like protein 2 n=1 Tax=Senna tora TaxID=362788 RepID=A0A834SKB6_9FABA|nr:Aspartic proteinase-like protein 2 [Senna tora]